MALDSLVVYSLKVQYHIPVSLTKEKCARFVDYEFPIYFSFHEIFFGIPEGEGRDAAWQAGMQAAAIAITLGIAITGGLATGTYTLNK